MPAKKVTLYIRPTMPDGSRPFLKPAYTPKGKLREGYALIKGNPEAVSNPTYYLSYLANGKRIPKLVGKSAGDALAEQDRITKRLAAIASGNDDIPDKQQPVTVESPTVKDAIDDYLAAVANLGRAQTP